MLRALALFALCLTLAACNKSDDDTPTETPIPPPEWRTGINFVDLTNVPQVQIDRFVEANGIDTVQTASGLVYHIDEPGGAEKPTASSSVAAHYRGYLLNGRIFDQTTAAGPRAFNLNQVIAGWTEGLQKIGRGGKIWMVVRPSLGYGSGASQQIPANSVLVFEIQLIDFQ